MGESEIISILSKSEIFNITSILKTLIRGIGWELLIYFALKKIVFQPGLM